MADYRLLDFGDGRKLESIGDFIIDRPSPAACGYPKLKPRIWRNANSVFVNAEKQKGWRHYRVWPNPLHVDCDSFRMPVEPTPFGHIGLFPEQYPNWKWIHQYVETGCRQLSNRTLESGRDSKSFRVLNLFAYTGASTMAAAAVAKSGALITPELEGLTLEVVHVDAAKPNVEAAKRAASINSFLSGDAIPSLAIRFMVDDARKFVAREIRRERTYDLIILDPPAYGHGAKGAAWRLDRDLWPLLHDCLRILRGSNCALLLTGHTEGCGPEEVRQWLARRRIGGWSEQSGRAGLEDQTGRLLDAGFYMRVTWDNLDREAVTQNV